MYSKANAYYEYYFCTTKDRPIAAYLMYRNLEISNYMPYCASRLTQYVLSTLIK